MPKHHPVRDESGTLAPHEEPDMSPEAPTIIGTGIALAAINAGLIA